VKIDIYLPTTRQGNSMLGTKIARKRLLAIFLFSFPLFGSGCHRGPELREWDEEVLLEDGRTIEVHRTVTFNETNSLSGDSYNAVETGATVSFKGSLATLPAWSEPLMALVMYQDATTEEWVIVATTTSCQVWRQRGEPRPQPYWEFRLGERGWREVPLSAASIGRAANLLHRYQKSVPKRMTADDRKSLESDPMMGRSYKMIVNDARDFGCNPGPRKE
jgi:hypothetical protein